MMIQNIQKDQLAKLLAMEDIHIRHSANASTASFDVKNRVLTLPVWADMTADIVDMLTGHEVGHSLWTLPDEWEEAIDEGIHKGILNIVEDARIEKKIKRKYPGIVKPFLSAYKELYSRKFFGDKHPSALNFIDRINLFFKLGHMAGIKFSSEEQQYVDLVGSCESFDDVVEVSKLLQIAYTEEVSTMLDDHDWELIAIGSAIEGETGGESIEVPGDLGEDGENSESSEDSLDEGDERGDEAAGDSPFYNTSDDFDPEKHGISDDEEFTTEDTWENRKQELVEDSKNAYQYIGLPKANLKSMIVPYKKVLKELGAETIAAYNESYPQLLAQADDEYGKFRTSSRKIVNYMAKEFERKKAAEVYRRQVIAKTGVLDVNKVHQYRYNDDIFLKKTLIPDGKNHGLVMLVDWSASMYYCMHDTLKQILNLTWFCQKVNIPFEVYAFSTAYPSVWDQFRKDDRENGVKFDDWKDKIDDNDWQTWNIKGNNVNFGNHKGLDNFRLLQMFSSKMNAKDVTKMMKLMFRYGWGHEYRYEKWGEYDLGSTPTLPA